MAAPSRLLPRVAGRGRDDRGSHAHPPGHVPPAAGPSGQEICGGAAGEAAGFGARPTLFRPPYGVFDHATLRAAHACHLAAVVEWSATVDHGRLVVVGGRLRPGDIILMHFRPSLPRDLTTALDAIRQAHLTVGRLPSYLQFLTASQ